MDKISCIKVTYESVPATILTDTKQPDLTCLYRAGKIPPDVFSLKRTVDLQPHHLSPSA